MDEHELNHGKAVQARERLHMIDAILERSGRAQRPLPGTYVAWGLTGALFNAAYVPAFSALSSVFTTSGEICTGIAYLLTALEYTRARRLRQTPMDRQALAVFAGVTTTLWVLKWIWLSNGLVDGVAFSLMWSLGFAIALLVHGSGPMRALSLGGVVLLICVFVASFVPSSMALVLMIGNLLGVAGPGVYFALRSTR